MDSNLKTVGRKLADIRGTSVVTGDYPFTSDYVMPGMLIGKVLRSPYAHARILDINVSKALGLPGTRAVITAQDTPGVPFCFGPQRPNNFVLQKEKVRFVGDQVAAVAAVDEDTALEALSLIKVSYEELPAVFDAEKAMEPDAPLLHEEKQNISFHMARNFGDPERGLLESDEIFEDTFSTHPVTHCCLETRCSLAQFDSSGRLAIWTTTQVPHPLRFQLAQVLNLPLNSIRVISPDIGGAFGERLGMDPIDPIAAILSRYSGKPVKIIKSREEEFLSARGRCPMKVSLKTGVKKNGKLVVRKALIITDNGAYNHHGLAIMGAAASKVAALYAIPSISLEGYLVYTNNGYCGPFRGYGNPQVTFAIESQMDKIAHQLGIDPVEIRLMNANKTGQTTSSGARIMSCGLEECIRSVAERSNWKKTHSGDTYSGTGMAVMIHPGSGAKIFFGQDANSSSATIRIDQDGSVSVATGVGELGQGIKTSLSQIAAEGLGISAENIRMVTGDTDATPACVGAWGSRQLFMAGGAILKAAEDAKKQIAEVAAKIFEARPEDIELGDGMVFVKGSPGLGIAFAEIAARASLDHGKVIIGTGVNEDPWAKKPDMKTGYGNITSAYSFAAQSAEVEVNVKTGRVKVLRMMAAHDVGKTINPDIAEKQIIGGVIQGIGFALSENLVIRNGQIQNPNLLDYSVPLANDIPPVEVTLIETNDPYGPFGAKGVGETGLVPTAAAIANAVEAATGIRIRDLPIRPEKIQREWQALNR